MPHPPLLSSSSPASRPHRGAWRTCQGPEGIRLGMGDTPGGDLGDKAETGRVMDAQSLEGSLEEEVVSLPSFCLSPSLSSLRTPGWLSLSASLGHLSVPASPTCFSLSVSCSPFLCLHLFLSGRLSLSLCSFPCVSRLVLWCLRLSHPLLPSHE